MSTSCEKNNEKNEDFNFCPLCQAPLLFLKISPFAHVAGCSVIWDILPACPEGKRCLSSSIFHYRDYAHCELAAYRSSNEFVNPSVEEFASNSAKKSPLKLDKKIKVSSVEHKVKKNNVCLTKEHGNKLIKNENFNKDKLVLKNKVDNSYSEDSSEECSVFKVNRSKKTSKRLAVSCDKNVRVAAKKFKNLKNESIISDVCKTETKDDLDVDICDGRVNTGNCDCDISSSSIDIFNDEIKCKADNKEDKICFSQNVDQSINFNYEKIEFGNEPHFMTSSPKQSNSSTPSISYSPIESDKSSQLCSENNSIISDGPTSNISVSKNGNQQTSPGEVSNTFKFVPKTERKYKVNSAERNKDSNSVQNSGNISDCIPNSSKNEKMSSLCHESNIQYIETNKSDFCSNNNKNDIKNNSAVFNIMDRWPTARSANNGDTKNISVDKRSDFLRNFRTSSNEKKDETDKVVEGLSSNTKRILAPKIFEKRGNTKVPDNDEINVITGQSIESVRRGSTGKKICPFYKRIPDTSMVVDAFQYGYIPGISAYFLTHFHSDHYVGLKKSFSMPIFCSEITANLVKMMIGVNETWLNVINVGERRIVNGTEVVALEANHCPGSLMFLFQLRTGQNYLHVGDFRFCSEMERYPELQKLRINKLFLDTTYCKPEYDFPAQDDIVNEVVNIAKDEVRKNPKLLFVCGSYVIGKEKVFRAIVKECNLNIWTESSRKRVFKCLNYPDILSKFKNNSSEAQVHVLPMNNITFEKLCQHLDRHNKFQNIVAFRPTGWALRQSRGSGCIQRRVQDRIVIYDVPYSEHSSFSELRRFVQFMKPDEIIPTVNMGKPALRDEMQKYFTSWLLELKQPRQSNLLNFLKSSKK